MKDEFISVRVQAQVKVKLQKIADEKDRPLSWVVNKILEESLENSRYELLFK
ncbi:MAG: hypothetical protein JKY66_06975 [Spongiibacteraceae bacterium]|nr:hypothetical protein [Spongiibacteraceae bacterium]